MTALAYLEPLFADGTREQLAVYPVVGATTADTFQTSTRFKKIYAAFWFPATGISVAGSCAISANTTVTFSPASIALDDGYLVVIGAPA